MNQRVLIEKNYLRIPIRKDAIEKNVWLYQELTAVLQFQAGLFVDYGSGAPDFYAELPVERWKGSVLTLVHEEDRPVPFLQSDELLPNTEPFQPWIHFAPKSGWMNDVCGACWYQGSYHLYFQHNPFGVQWNNMSWGHAVSSDLLHWQQLEEALLPEADGPAFTGSAVLHKGELPEVPEDALVVYYTCAGNRSVWSRGKKMCQKAAWSEDGIHFQTLGEILPNQIFENRDPKVYRFGQKHWFMVLFLDGHEFGIFVSDNMKDWRQTQSLVIPEAWECPDLVRLRVQSTGDEKWLFWTPDGFYLVGEFDGMQFTATQPGRRFYGSEKVYAAQTVANLDGRVLQIPFLRGHTQPYYNHRGLMGAPREMQLLKEGSEYFLSEPLCRELQQQKIPLWRRTAQKEPMEFCWEEDGAMLLQLTFSENTSFVLRICGERIEWDAEKKKLAFTFMNRLDIREIRNMTILADRGVLEIAVNEDTACYYVPGNGELVKSIELSGEMEAELFLIR